MALVALYVIARVVMPLQCRPMLRWLLALAIFLAAEKILLIRLLVGRTAAQIDLPPFLVFGTGFAQGFVVIAALLVLGRDVLLLGRWLWQRRSASQARPLPLWLRPAPLLLLALLCTGWGGWQATKVPEVRAIVLPIPALPAALQGLRIVQLSDLHIGVGFGRAWLEQVVARSNALKPDVIVITGDIVDGPLSQLQQSLASLGQLRARYGVFLVMGNHEYYSGFDEWLQEFRRLGITVLINEHRIVDIHGTPLLVAGITDPVASAHNSPPPDPAQALSGRPAGVFSLLLSHQPRTAADSAAAGAQLQLSGHTHGGLLLPLQSLIALFNEGFVAGPYTLGTMQLYVHPGSALWAGLPIRLGVPSEITEVTLR